MKNLLFVAAALLGACATQPPKPAATPVEMTECIALAAPAAKAGATINEALAARRSWREFGPEKLSLEELSGVLWAAAGENRTDGKLTAPSALALYPITVYAVFEEGIYRYDGREQTLTRVAEGDHRPARAPKPQIIKDLQNLLRKNSGTKATISGNEQQGRIQIPYASPEELTRILALLGLNAEEK